MIVEELKKTLALCCHVHTNHLICPSSYSREGKKQMQAEDHLPLSVKFYSVGKFFQKQ